MLHICRSLPLTYIQRNSRYRYIKSIGMAGTVAAETQALLNANSIDSSEFSRHELNCLKQFANWDDFSIPFEILEKELSKGRLDLRNELIFSIDPTTARDIDDALSIKKLENGDFEVGVHIADVSYFVKPDTLLDEVARSRATSTYLVQFMIPMLPERLSACLCSLNGHCERLAFSVFFQLHSDGTLNNQPSRFCRTIIKSSGQLNYDNAQDVIDGNESSLSENIKVAVLQLHSLAQARRKNRYESGALAINRSKIFFQLDENCNPINIMVYEHKESNQLIEEYMLLANELVANHLMKNNRECALLRRHPEPNPLEIFELGTWCSKFGIPFSSESSGELHKSLSSIESEELRNVVEVLLTQPMQSAEYFALGKEEEFRPHRHYGLNVDYYTHFTSPIRRYVDLVVHRQLAYIIGSEQYNISETEISHIANHCNNKKTSARKAQDASNDVFSTIYLVNKNFYTIGRITSWGLKTCTIIIPDYGFKLKAKYDDFIDGQAQVVKDDQNVEDNGLVRLHIMSRVCVKLEADLRPPISKIAKVVFAPPAGIQIDYIIDVETNWD